MKPLESGEFNLCFICVLFVFYFNKVRLTGRPDKVGTSCVVSINNTLISTLASPFSWNVGIFTLEMRTLLDFLSVG